MSQSSPTEANSEAFTVDTDARWKEIQELSHEIAYSDRVPSRIESALCGAVVRAREAMQEVARLKVLQSASGHRATADGSVTVSILTSPEEIAQHEAVIRESKAALAATLPEAQQPEKPLGQRLREAGFADAPNFDQRVMIETAGVAPQPATIGVCRQCGYTIVTQDAPQPATARSEPDFNQDVNLHADTIVERFEAAQEEASPAERLRDFLTDPECHIADDIPDHIWLPFCESLRSETPAGGMAKVPAKITKAMHLAACEVMLREGNPQEIMDAMLAAAPSPDGNSREGGS